jgi:spore coat polysaccharide biosynthesis protein SpsF
MLSYLLESLKQSKKAEMTVVATSTEASDDPVEEYCREHGVECFRGDLKNVASRFIGVIKKYSPKAFVRICADSPLHDYRLIDQALELFESGDYDLITNVRPRTFPKGLSVEVVDAEKFVEAYGKMKEEGDFEHVTISLYRPEMEFRFSNFINPGKVPVINLSVDTPEDLELTKSIIGQMERPHWEYSFEDIFGIYQKVSES